MKLSDILSDKELYCKSEALAPEIKRISLSPNITECGTLFVSLKGDLNAESKAIACGCSAILCDVEDRKYSVPVIHAKNVRIAYSVLCFKLAEIDLTKIKLIGVTGTNGKTSVARTVYSILNGCGHKCGFIGTASIELPEIKLSKRFYSMTTPDPEVLYPALKTMQEFGCQYAVMEVSSHSLYYEKLNPLNFSVSVFTNLSPEHLDFHKNISDYYLSKKKITDMTDTMIINVDDYYGKLLYSEHSGKKIGVGAVYESDVSVKNVKTKGFDGIEYMYYGKDFVFKADSRLCGIFNVYNTALALTAVIALGIKPHLAKEGLSKAEIVPGRFEVIHKSPTVVIDYAHTPMGFENFMKSLSYAARGRKISVLFGCGGDRDKKKRPQMAKVAEKFADKITVTSDNPRQEDPDAIISEILCGFSKKAKYRVIPDRCEAIRALINDADVNEVIAIVGKGEEGYIIDKDGYHTHSDRECATNAIKLRKRAKSEN